MSKIDILNKIRNDIDNGEKADDVFIPNDLTLNDSIEDNFNETDVGNTNEDFDNSEMDGFDEDDDDEDEIKASLPFIESLKNKVQKNEEESETISESEPITELEPEPELTPEPVLDSELEPVTETIPESVPEPEPEHEPKSESELKSEPETVPEEIPEPVHNFEQTATETKQTQGTQTLNASSSDVCNQRKEETMDTDNELNIRILRKILSQTKPNFEGLEFLGEETLRKIWEEFINN